jgi:hypothetical protein
MNTFKFLLIITFLITSFFAFNQKFAPLSTQVSGLPNYAEVGKWIDFDNDNDLDIIFSVYNSFGKSYHKLYLNLGNDSFQYFLSIPTTYNSPNFYFNDFNNDGWIDLVSNDSLYFNFFGTFQLAVDSCFYQPTGSIFIQSGGNLYNSGKVGIYKALNGNFMNRYLFIPKSDSCSFSNKGITPDGLIVDLNNDGYNDVFNSNSININMGFNTLPQFTLISNFNFYTVYNLDILDINSDGYIDYSISGKNLNPTVTSRIMLNNSNGFTFISYPYINLKDTNVTLQKFIDLNNDGRLDVLQSYYDGQTAETYLFLNDSILNYSIDSSFSTGGRAELILPADYDNDGDLDLFICSEKMTSPGYITALYRNDSTPPNTPPTAPQVMWTEMDSNKIIFRWRPATDVETPQATLSYNLMVGTSPKGIDITSPMADTVTGFRRVVELGNSQLNNFYILDKSNFALGDTLYWSVQTIDNGFGYSPFSRGNSAIVHQYMTLENRTLCSNIDSISWRGHSFDSAGIYFHGNGVVSNFDSAFFLQLDTAPAYLQSQTINLCAGSSYNWNGQILMSSGIYNKYYTTTQGCDSIERLVLSIHPDYTNVQTADLCLGDSVALGNQWLSTAGVYFDTIQSIFGCDSLVWLTIAVAPDDSTVIQTADSLVAQSSTAQILWWDCDKQQFIYGVGGQVFVPQYNGHFAAELTQNGCTYRTRCFEVINVGILSLSKGSPQINIRPNPSSGKVFINASETILSITLIDSYGKIITEIEELKTKEIELDISQFAPGIYTLKVETEVGVEMRKLVKE